MNEEKRILTAFNLSRISEKHSTFYAFMSQKSESLTHSFFFDGFRSKVIARVTRNSPSALSCSSCAYLALRGCELLHPLPMVGWFGFA